MWLDVNFFRCGDVLRPGAGLLTEGFQRLQAFIPVGGRRQGAEPTRAPLRNLRPILEPFDDVIVSSWSLDI